MTTTPIRPTQGRGYYYAASTAITLAPAPLLLGVGGLVHLADWALYLGAVASIALYLLGRRWYDVYWGFVPSNDWDSVRAPLWWRPSLPLASGAIVATMLWMFSTSPVPEVRDLILPWVLGYATVGAVAIASVRVLREVVSWARGARMLVDVHSALLTAAVQAAVTAALLAWFGRGEAAAFMSGALMGAALAVVVLAWSLARWALRAGQGPQEPTVREYRLLTVPLDR